MSSGGIRVPPGRAGRLWLDGRLAVARRGADLLDRKLRILRAELAVRQSAANRAEADWARCRAEADRWLIRAGLLAGQRALRLAASGQPAQIEISYTVTMGVRHPVDATCVIPPPDGGAGPALTGARQAHGAALTAAVRYAAAAEALRLIEAETVATRYRLRAVRDRWIPRLEQALTEVTAAIEEQELADAARLRRAARS